MVGNAAPESLFFLMRGARYRLKRLYILPRTLQNDIF